MSQPGQAKISAYYVYYVASQAVFDRGIFILFLMSRQFSGEQIGLLQAALFWATVASEVPTGVIGDRYGRKLSVSLGLGLFILYCASVIFFSGFLPFLLLYCVYGVAKSFISGSDRALLFDYLRVHGREGDFLRIDSRSRALGALAMALAIAAGGYLQRVSWSLVYVAYGLALGVSLLAWSRIRDVQSEEMSGSAHEARVGILQQLRQFFLEQPGRGLMMIILASALLVGTITPYYIFSQAIFKEHGLEPYQIGAVIAVSEILAAVAYLLAERVSRLISLEYAFYLASAVTAGLLLLNQVNDLHLLVVIFLMIVSLGPLFEVLVGNHLISKVPAPIRASAMSIVSFVESMVISVGYLGYGYALELYDVRQFVAASALLPCLAAWCAFVYFNRAKGALA
ncbi:MFS transporter [Melittangium boletus]|uniref:MFS transporter n=1 Tax=Melittangium boletus DSM 14713 TaxID=1294270 RepID=A0A250IRE2_9BACT|nr:MFS transporter [Melittangium boletus]ATB34309.1 MFS transporter [Melittangium boletus DSM 14713]